MTIDENNIITLKTAWDLACSCKRDTSNICKIISDEKVVNFSCFINDKYRNRNINALTPCSVNALCMLDDKWCFIDFENVDLENSTNLKKLLNKMSVSVFNMIFNENLNPNIFKENSVFILVYDENKLNHSEEIFKIMTCWGKGYRRKFKLADTFENFCFSKVLTLNVDEFNKFIKNKKITIPKLTM